MSYFKNGVAYVLVPKLDVTTEMINNSKRDFNANLSTLRESNQAQDADKKILFKVKHPFSAIFNGYPWFNHKEILVELEKSEWL